MMCAAAETLQRLSVRTACYTDIGRDVTDRSRARREVIDIRVLGYPHHGAWIAAGTVNDETDVVSLHHTINQMCDVRRSERACPWIGDRDRRVRGRHVENVPAIAVKERRIPITEALQRLHRASHGRR